MVKEIVIESVLHGTLMNLPYFVNTILCLKQKILANLKGVKTEEYSYMMIFYDLTIFIVVIPSYLLLLLLVGISIWYLVGEKLKKSDKVIVLFFLLWGMFTFPKALGRADISHLVPSITPLFFLLIFLLQKGIKLFEKNKTFLEKFITYGFIITTFLLLVPASVNSLRWMALLIPHHEVSTDYGRLLFLNESAAKDVNSVIEFINKTTQEEDYIFVTPWYAPPFYALTNSMYQKEP